MPLRQFSRRDHKETGDKRSNTIKGMQKCVWTLVCVSTTFLDVKIGKNRPRVPRGGSVMEDPSLGLLHSKENYRLTEPVGEMLTG